MSETNKQNGKGRSRAGVVQVGGETPALAVLTSGW